MAEHGVAHGGEAAQEHFRGGGEVESHALGSGEIGAVVEIHSLRKNSWGESTPRAEQSIQAR